ncbi:10660_t:CDS:2 [Dentiscutata erythropus]|uniref:10660_t:CDS:1 n=1 Tax=Dentiscutata erythropus TaxID=1348616 RepID=A0A9N9CPT2_9GLOM|nr:10660_t:CDS:2 [Dentiscutata erythropus]
MSDESTSNAKKSRSLSDAERRLIRRQKRILNNANGRLDRITSTHSSSPLATEDTDPQKLFNNENPPVSSSTLGDKLFHKDHENPPVSPSMLDDKLFHKDHENPPVSSTLNDKLFHKDHENPPVSSILDDDNDGFFVNNEHSRRKLTNLDPANSSTPFPFLPFLNPDLINPVPPVQQLDFQSKLWQLIHFFAMIMLGLLVTWFEVLRRDGSWSRFTKLTYRNPNEISETDRPLFWYFITIELILQSSRLFIQKGRTFGGTTLGAIAASLPPPLSDALTLLMRYNLIWNSLWEDVCVHKDLAGVFISLGENSHRYG